LTPPILLVRGDGRHDVDLLGDDRQDLDSLPAKSNQYTVWWPFDVASGGRPGLLRGARMTGTPKKDLLLVGSIRPDSAEEVLRRRASALACEWGQHGIRVNAVAPGYISTDLTRGLTEDEARYAAIRARIPMGRWGTPKDVAGAVTMLCSPLARYVTGQVVYVDGGYTADG
jgi:hypothetical protein